MTSSAGLHTLKLHCPPEGVTGSATYTHKVKKMAIKQCEVDMCEITSLTRHLDVGHIEMDDVTLSVDGEVSTVIYRLF